MDTDTDQTNETGGQPAVQPKYYEAHAQSRRVIAGQAAEQITFVVEGEGYKEAWQSARNLTAVGDAHFEGNAWTDNTRTTKMKMVPAKFTVHELKSLQQRTSKVAPVTLDTFVAEFAKSGKPMPKAVQDIIDGLRRDGPPAPPEVAPENEGESKAA
jgi:hypothetical protein